MATQSDIDSAYEKYQQQTASQKNISSDDIDSAYQKYLNGQLDQQAANFPQPQSTADKIRGHLKSVGAGLLQPSINLASGIQTEVNQTIKAIDPSYHMMTPVNADPNLQLVANAPNQSEANLAQIPGAFLAPGGNAVKAFDTLKGSIGAAGALGGLYGLGYGKAANPDSSSLYDVATGIATGAGLQGALRGIGSVAQNLINKPLTRIQQQAEKEKSFGVQNRPLTPAEAKQRLQTAQQTGIKPSLGTLTNDPQSIQSFENSAFTPFNNQQTYAAENIGRADQLGSDIYNDLNRGLNREEIAPTLTNEINDIFNAKKAQSKENYDNLANMADQVGVQGNRSNAQAYALDQLSKYQNAKNMGKLTALDPDTLDILKTVSKDITPTEETPYTFSDLKDERSIVGEKLNQLRESNPKATTAENILNNLYSKYSDDMNDTLQYGSFRSQELLDSWKKANNFHRDEVTPYYQGRLPYILKNETHEKITNELINNSKYRDLIASLPADTKKLLLGSKIASTLPSDDFSANKFLSGYNRVAKTANITPLTMGLTQNINGTEIPIKDALDKLSTISEMNEPLKKIKSTIPTGYALKGAQQSGLPVSLGALIGLGAHGSWGALAGAGAGTAYAGIKGRLTSNYLKNPEVLRAYSNPLQRAEILKNAYPLINKVPANLPAGLNAMLNYFINQNQ
jgi:hypothetical protein